LLGDPTGVSTGDVAAIEPVAAITGALARRLREKTSRAASTTSMPESSRSRPSTLCCSLCVPGARDGRA